jgi:hypothetical protein
MAPALVLGLGLGLAQGPESVLAREQVLDLEKGPALVLGLGLGLVR